VGNQIGLPNICYFIVNEKKILILNVKIL